MYYGKDLMESKQGLLSSLFGSANCIEMLFAIELTRNTVHKHVWAGNNASVNNANETDYSDWEDNRE